MPDQGSAATEHAILQEITGPLEALPDDPLAIINAEFPTALRGYDRLAVDEYVQRTRQLVAELQATRSPESAVRRALERVGDEITGILQRAHETAEQITSQSRSEAEDRLEEARQEAAQIIAAAEQRVRDLDADTDRIWLERQRIVGDAEELAAQLQSLAKAAMDRFPADTGAEAAGSAPAAAAPGERPPPVPFGAGEDEDEYLHEPPEFAADEDVDETVPFHPVGSPGEQEGEAEPEPAAATGAEAAPHEEEPEPHDEEPGPQGGEPGPQGGEPGPQGGEPGPQGEGHGPGGQPASGAEPAPPDGPSAQGPSTADDTTAVIPPASEAGSRRLSQ